MSGYKKKHDYEAIKKALQSGLTYSQITKKFSCSESTIRNCRFEVIGERNRLADIKDKQAKKQAAIDKKLALPRGIKPG